MPGIAMIPGNDAILALLNPEQEGNKEQCSVDLNTSWLV
jgi:hypothetical protein